GKIENNRVGITGRRLLIDCAPHFVRGGYNRCVGGNLEFRSNKVRVLNRPDLGIKRRKEIEDAWRIKRRLAEIEVGVVDHELSAGGRGIERAINIGQANESFALVTKAVAAGGGTRFRIEKNSLDNCFHVAANSAPIIGKRGCNTRYVSRRRIACDQMLNQSLSDERTNI